MKLTANVGGWDRGIRLILGVLLFILGFVGVFRGTLAVIAYIVGAIALVTGLITFCPINALLGFNSRNPSQSPEAGAEKPAESGAGGPTDQAGPQE